MSDYGDYSDEEFVKRRSRSSTKSDNEYSDEDEESVKKTHTNKPIKVLKGISSNRQSGASSTLVNRSSRSHSRDHDSSTPSHETSQTSIGRNVGHSSSVPQVPIVQQRNSQASTTLQQSGKTIKIMSEDISKLKDLSLLNECLTDGVGYLVVAAVGLQGSGKSTILNCLAQNMSPDHSTSQGPFQVQDLDNFLTNLPATIGLDVHVTPDRVILIDTQPLLSLALTDMYAKQETRRRPWQPTNSDSVDYSSTNIPVDTWAEYTSLQILTFLLAVCHVIIVVEDHFTDFNLLRLLDTACMLKPSVYTQRHPPSNTKLDVNDTGVVDYTAKLIHVVNKAPAQMDSCRKSCATVYSRLFTQTALIDRALQTPLTSSSKAKETSDLEDETAPQDDASRGGSLEGKHSEESDTGVKTTETAAVVNPDEKVEENKPTTAPPPATKASSEPNESNSTIKTSTGDPDHPPSTETSLIGSHGVLIANHIDQKNCLVTEAPDATVDTSSRPDHSHSMEKETGSNNDIHMDEQKQHQFEYPTLFILPDYSDKVEDRNPSFKECVSDLRDHVFSISRQHMIHSGPPGFTEKKWLQFMKSMWDNTTTSSLLADYHRLIAPAIPTQP